MESGKKYYRYRMSFPLDGNVIYRSKSFPKVVRKCYGEYKQMESIHDGLFSVTNLDKNVEYRFRVSDGRARKVGRMQK